MSTTTTGRQPSWATGLKLHLGPFITLTADAVPVRRANSKKEVSFSLVCPTCLTKCGQRYVCDAHGTFEPGEMARGRVNEDGTMADFTPDEIDAITGDFEVGDLEFQVCPRDEIEASCRPQETAYRLRLDKKNRGDAKTYALLLALAQHPFLALYGVCKLREKANPTPFTLQTWRDQLVLQSLIRPQDLTEKDEEVAAADPKHIEMGIAFLEQMASAFEPDMLRNTKVERLAAVLAAKNGAEATITTLPVVEDLMAALEASLAAARVA